MNFAPLILLIFCELLLYWAQRYIGLSAEAHLPVSIALAGMLLLILAALRRREGRVMTGLRREISGMEEEKVRAGRRYKALMDGAGNAIFVFNADSGVLEEVNRLGIELLGFTQKELSCMLGRDLLHPDEHEKFRSFVYQLKRRGRGSTEGLQFQKRDGTLFLGEIDGKLIELGDQQVVHCIVRDVTEKKQAEREIWQRNRELSILNNILTGMNRGHGLDGVPQETLSEIMDLFRADGGTIHLFGLGDEPPHLAVSQGVAPALEKAIASFVGAAPHHFREIRVLCGEATEKVFGAAAREWGCLTSVPLMVQGHLIGVMHLMQPCARHYRGEELRFLESVGKQVANVVEKNRLFAELNWKSAELLRSHHLLEKTSHNLSVSEKKLKRNLALVEQANLELSRLDRMKNQFLGMVSHEFNTPLTSIISGSEYLLQSGASGADAAPVLQMVRDGGLRLKELVADLLKLVRLQAQGDEIERSAVHLGEFLESMKENLRRQLEERKQTVELIDLEGVPYFDADREDLERIFGELLLNAMKFSPKGSRIEVSGRVVEKSALLERRETLERFNAEFLKRCGDRCYLQVEVRDQGIGVPTEEQQGIFEIFYEVGDIRHHSSGSSIVHGKGAGLGLAMVKGMVEAHGGMVWVESTAGSSFFLLLPLEQEVAQPALF